MRLKCLKCNDLISAKLKDNIVYCQCGRTGFEKVGDYKYEAIGEYEFVDDEGNKIITEDEIVSSKVNEDNVEYELCNNCSITIYNKLMENLDGNIQTIQNYSHTEQHSPAVKKELLAHLLWCQLMAQNLHERLRALESVQPPSPQPRDQGK